jgi:uncharacterized linocin/CFP29 family protein
MADLMDDRNPQVPWTAEQWSLLNRVLQQEAARARSAANFLPLVGPLAADVDFVRANRLLEPHRHQPDPAAATNPNPPIGFGVMDREVIQLASLQVTVPVRSAQMADPELESVQLLFRRAANVLARLEDFLVFQGQPAAGHAPALAYEKLPPIWTITGGGANPGLYPKDDPKRLINPYDQKHIADSDKSQPGSLLVSLVSEAIGRLEDAGQFGPFALVLGQGLFTEVQTPNAQSLVLPQDRILPFLGSGGSLLRSSTLEPHCGVLMALAGQPVELVVASDMAVSFLQITPDPAYLFRVSEKICLRIRQPQAILGIDMSRNAKEAVK